MELCCYLYSDYLKGCETWDRIIDSLKDLPKQPQMQQEIIAFMEVKYFYTPVLKKTDVLWHGAVHP